MCKLHKNVEIRGHLYIEGHIFNQISHIRYEKQKNVIKEFPSINIGHVLSMKETLIKNVHVYLINKKTPTWTICENSDILISI